MRYWLLRRPPLYSDINPTFAGRPWEYDKVFVNPRLHAGDVIYLLAAYSELYGWGYIIEKESYQDNELNGRTYKITVSRPVVQLLTSRDEVKNVSQLAPLFSTADNLIELNADQVAALNQMLAAKGVITPPPKTSDELQSTPKPCIDFPRLKVPPDVEVWMRAVYERVKNGRTVDPQHLVVELWSAIPDFNYRAIDNRLMHFGLELTLLGILQIDPSTELCDQTDRVIRLIKERIQSEPKIEKISSEEVSETLEIPEARISLIFLLMRHLGDFWNGGASNGNVVGYTSITISDEHVKRLYLRYERLEMFLEQLARIEKIPMSEAPAEPEVVHASLDWKLRERRNDALNWISTLSGDKVSSYDSERLAEAVKRFEVEPLLLAPKPLRDETMPELEDMTFDRKTGVTGHIFLLPIEGDGEWLQEIDMQNVSVDDSPLAFFDKARNWIYIKLTVAPDEPAGILKQKLDARLARVRQYADYVNKRIKAFNSDLGEEMVRELNKRKTAIEKGRAEAAVLDLEAARNPRHAERAIQIEKLTERLNARFNPRDAASNPPESEKHEQGSESSDIQADALTIAKYMYTHKFFGSRSTTRDELRQSFNLSNADFDVADEYLLAAKIYEGTVGGESGRRWLTSEGINFVKTNSIAHGNETRNVGRASVIDIFISHSSKDITLAKAVADLLRVALNVSADRIRCTSVDGYRLPGGVDTSDRLRLELRESKSLIALVTDSSIGSTYVLFELGARWGAELPLVPLLATSADTRLLGGPLGALNALTCDSRSQIHQLIDDVASHIEVEPVKPASYQEYIDAVLECAASREHVETKSVPSPSTGADFERMSLHVLNYLTAKGFTKHVGFESLRKYVNSSYSNEMLFQMIDEFPSRFRRVTLRGGKPAVGLVQTQNKDTINQ